MAKEISEMAAGDLVHFMLVTFSKHRVSVDRYGEPDHSPWAQGDNYGAACERLNELLPPKGEQN